MLYLVTVCTLFCFSAFAMDNKSQGNTNQQPSAEEVSWEDVKELTRTRHVPSTAERIFQQDASWFALSPEGRCSEAKAVYTAMLWRYPGATGLEALAVRDTIVQNCPSSPLTWWLVIRMEFLARQLGTQKKDSEDHMLAKIEQYKIEDRCRSEDKKQRLRCIEENEKK